jgi:hypothetical protein
MKEKTDPNIIQDLHSGKESLILSKIDHLRETGNPLYIPFLIDLLLKSESEEVRRNILLFLSDMKDRNAKPYMIEAIENEKYTSLQKELLTCIWQNSLDYSDYLSLFIGLVIHSEFETAFEAFTVIDNLEELPPKEVIEPEIQRINKALEKSAGSKIYLLQELRSILS